MSLDQKDRFLSLRKRIIEREFRNMNNMQKKAVFNIKGPVLILAGAGSGKTTVLINRIENIVKFGNAYLSDEINPSITEEDINHLESCMKNNTEIPKNLVHKLAVNPCAPWRILAITFTNKAADELKDRLNLKLGQSGSDVWASTFHSFCAKLLRFHAELLGYTKSFAVYDSDDSKRLIKDIQKQFGIDEEDNKSLSVRSILSAISKAKNKFISAEDMINQAGYDMRQKTIGEIYEEYQKKLKKSGAMDFDDLLLNTVKLLENFPEVLDKYQSKFEYIMVDEYQDTNLVQYKLIELLSKKHHNLCVVGDDDQSIYKFRGADIENILNFEHTFPNSLVIKLEQNYRSTQNILNVANAVISNNSHRKSKALWTENENGDLIQLHTACNEHNEAIYIRDKIFAAVEKGASYSDFAVLYRMNSQSNVIEKVFVRSGIPYRIIGGCKFYDRREIRDMLAYLSVINNINDEVRLKRIINKPKRKIGDRTIMAASNIAESLGIPLFEVLGRADEFADLSRSQQKLKAFHYMMTDIMDKYYKEHLSISEIYSMILDVTNYEEAIEQEKDFDQERIENIKELLTNITVYENENGEDASLAGFLEEVSLMTDIDNYNQSADRVVLMTMHCAKGLEFPTVFLPGFEDALFPGRYCNDDLEQLEEERRLAYVGITRAKSKLYITNSESRTIFGQTTASTKPSRFIGEIPEKYINKSREKDHRKVDLNLKNYKPPIDNTSVKSAKNFNRNHSAVSKDSFNSGETVFHKTFGKGLIIKNTPVGNDSLLEIVFDEPIGTKKLMANFAKLQKA